MTGSSKKARARLAARGPASARLATRTGPGMAHTYSRRRRARRRSARADAPGGRPTCETRAMSRPVPFVHPVDVRYLEVDRQGVVFNMWYLAYLDDALTAFLAEGGLPYAGHARRRATTSRSCTPSSTGTGRWATATRPTVQGDVAQHRTDVVHAPVRRGVGGERVVADASTVYVSVRTDGSGKCDIPAALLAALGPVRRRSAGRRGPATCVTRRCPDDRPRAAGRGCAGRASHEAPPVVGGQAVEKGPCHELRRVPGARRHRLDPCEAAGQDRGAALDLGHEPGHVVGQLGEDGGHAGIAVGGLDQVQVAVDEPRRRLQHPGDAVIEHMEIYEKQGNDQQRPKSGEP